MSYISWKPKERVDITFPYNNKIYIWFWGKQIFNDETWKMTWFLFTGDVLTLTANNTCKLYPKLKCEHTLYSRQQSWAETTRPVLPHPLCDIHICILQLSWRETTVHVHAFLLKIYIGRLFFKFLRLAMEP